MLENNDTRQACLCGQFVSFLILVELLHARALVLLRSAAALIAGFAGFIPRLILARASAEKLIVGPDLWA